MTDRIPRPQDESRSGHTFDVVCDLRFTNVNYSWADSELLDFQHYFPSSGAGFHLVLMVNPVRNPGKLNCDLTQLPRYCSVKAEGGEISSVIFYWC